MFLSAKYVILRNRYKVRTGACIMEHSDIKLLLKNTYADFTAAEKSVADFFIGNNDRVDLSSRKISSSLYVSEASLSRFAQKCGFKGYREFAYEYERYFDESNKFRRFDELTKTVLSSYQELLDRSFDLVNENQMRRVASLLSESRCVYVYGMGSSGIAAREMKLRFMRTGMLVEAITDSHMIKMNSALVDDSMVVIAISLSGVTKEIVAGMKLARSRGAKVILMTANTDPKLEETADEILHVAGFADLSKGTMISPQFPILVMIDIFYSYYFNNDEFFNRERHIRTMSALE